MSGVTRTLDGWGYNIFRNGVGQKAARDLVAQESVHLAIEEEKLYELEGR